MFTEKFVNDGLRHSATITLATYVFYMFARIKHYAIAGLASTLLTISMAILVCFIVGKAFFAIKNIGNKR
jgi:hypothetical protein